MNEDSVSAVVLLYLIEFAKLILWLNGSRDMGTISFRPMALMFRRTNILRKSHQCEDNLSVIQFSVGVGSVLDENSTTCYYTNVSNKFI